MKNNNKKRNCNSRSQQKQKVVREQPKKDSGQKRVNFDNARVDRAEKEIREVNSVGKENDVSWYNKVPGMYNPAANMSYLPLTGLPENGINSTAVPGLYCDYWIPSLGAPVLTAVNQVKESLYSFVVHANSRNTTYDANDLFMTFVAGANIFSYLGTLIRAYGTMMQWKALNLNTPRMLISAMGFDYDDFESNLPHMLFDINNMISQSRQIWVPNDFPFVARWFWMNSNIYKDADSVKAQYYMHVQDAYLMFSETISGAGTALIPVSPRYKASGTNVKTKASIYDFIQTQQVNSGTEMKAKLLQWNDAVAFFHQLLEPLLNSTYRGVMMGDVLKAYGADKLYTIGNIDSGYSVEPVYHAEVLTQIENTIITKSDPVAFFQDQNKNTIEPVFCTTGGGSAATPGGNYDGLIINFHHDHQPTPDELMVATRLRPGVLNNAQAQPYSLSNYDQFNLPTGQDIDDLTLTPLVEAVITGSEFINGAIIYVLSYGNNTTGSAASMIHDLIQLGKAKLSTIPFTQFINVLYGGSAATSITGLEPTSGPQTFVSQVIAWTAFDWSPWIYLPLTLNGSLTIQAKLGDFDNYSDLPRTSVGNMHAAALFSELGIPFVG